MRAQRVTNLIDDMTWRYGFAGWAWVTEILRRHQRVMRETKPEEWIPLEEFRRRLGLT